MFARCLLLLLLMLFLLPFSEAHGFDLSTLPRWETGLTVGFGTGDIKEGKYEPLLLTLHIGYDLGELWPALKSHKGRLSAFAEPQFNPVLHPSEYEAGIGFGFMYMYPLPGNFSVFIMGSIGPHYISVDTDDLARGFTFSDTLGAGFQYFISENSGISAGYRLRHMSNCGLREPNSGINTDFFTLGFTHFF